jgi:hypothetical protein
MAGNLLDLDTDFAKMALRSVCLEGRRNVLKREGAVNNGLQTIDGNRTDHVLLIRPAANGDPANAYLI